MYSFHFAFSANTILTTKWEAWTACAGMTGEAAMLDYIEIVEQLKASQQTKPSKTEERSEPIPAIPDFYMNNIVHVEETRAGLPKQMLHKLERTCQLVLDIFEDDSTDWEGLLKEKKLIAKRNIITPLAQIKAELWMPFNIHDIFSAFINPTILLDLYDTLDEIDIQHAYSAHSFLEYRLFSKVINTTLCCFD